MAQTIKDWHPAEVKAALEKAGSQLCPLVVEHGYHVSAGGKALRRSWPAVERIIARALDRHPKEIWPSRYRRDGSPLQEGRWPNHSTRPDRPAHQKSLGA